LNIAVIQSLVYVQKFIPKYSVILLIPSLDISAQRVTGPMAKAEWSQPS